MKLKRITAVMLSMALLATQLPAMSFPSVSADAMLSNENCFEISSDILKVTLNKKFPSIVNYEWLENGEHLKGNPYEINTVRIDEVDYHPEVTVNFGKDHADYTLTFPKINVVIGLRIAITDQADNKTTAEKKNIVSYKVTGIQEKGDFKVHTIEIPNNRIFTLSSSDKGAQFVGVQKCSSVVKTGDVFLDLATAKPDANVQKYEYAIINDDGLAGTFRSNASSMRDNNLVLKQTVSKGAGTETAVWSNKWTYRIPDYTKTFDDIRWDYTDREGYKDAKYDPDNLTFPTDKPQPAPGAEVVSQNKQTTEYPNVTVEYKDVATMELPVVEIVVTPDNNGDGVVDWMDGANGYREVRYLPNGWENVKNSPVQRLIHPHSSLAGYTFMESLDETKKVYQATDGLGQIILHKVFNYANWGDFTHYAENLGGYEDFKKFVDVATEEYNGYVGLHTNFTEVFAKSKNFRPETINPGNGGYGGFGYWYHQCYSPDKVFEAITKERRDRLVGFKQSIPNLGFIYSDVFSEDGLLDRRLVDDYEEAGLGYFVEWPYQSEERSVWSHWAVEKNYSPPNLCAYGSNVARFINNDIKDRWDNNKIINGTRIPGSSQLLMGADTTAWEGWSATETNNEYDKALRKVFDNNIPTKYLQRNAITRWTYGKDGYVNHIWFENGMESYFSGDVNDLNTRKRVITQNGKKVYEGTAKDRVNDSQYLIPWDLEENGKTEKEGKLYHWNEMGGDSTWQLPDSWDNVRNVKVYELSDQGKINEKVIPVEKGSITLANIKKDTAYVVYKGDKTPVNKEVHYGEGAFLKDPGFNYGKVDGSWTLESGNASVIRCQRNEKEGYRGYELLMGKGQTVVSQMATGLEPNKEYVVSVMVEVENGKKRTAALEVIPDGGKAKRYEIHSSLWINSDVMCPKAGTHMLPIQVTITAPASGKANVRLIAGEGDAQVRFDSVRIFRTETPKNPKFAKDKVLIYQDFEYAATGHKEPKPYVTTGNEYMVTYQGYYPFVLNGAVRESRMIIEQINSPYTQNGSDSRWDKKTAIVDEVISGRNSFKSVKTPMGVFVSTTPNSVQFTPGKEYRVTFKYQTQPSTDYAVAIGTKPGVATDYDVLIPTSKSTTYTKTFVATSEDQWVGFARVAENNPDDPTPFVLDDFLIEEIGDGVLPPDEHIQVFGTYEFENAEFAEGPAGQYPMEVSNDANASGGKAVNNFQDTGDTLTFKNVNVEKNGTYMLEVDYAAGYNSRTLPIIVNGGSPILAPCPKTGGWNIYQTLKVPVSLKKGSNEIVFSLIGDTDLAEGKQGRVNLDCLRIVSCTNSSFDAKVYQKLDADQLMNIPSVTVNGVERQENAADGAYLRIPQGSSVQFAQWNYRYGAGGISIMAKGLQKGKIEAYQGSEKLGQVDVQTTDGFALYDLKFERMVKGYGDITLKFIGAAEGELMMVRSIQFTERREAEDSFLENNVEIQTDGGSGRGYINGFETTIYNPKKEDRAVKFIVNLDGAQRYDMEIAYAFAESMAKDALSLYVNGTLQRNISFPGTGGWKNFSTVKVPVVLQKGMNVVSLCIAKDEKGAFVNSGRVNVDYFRLIPAGFDASQKIEAELFDSSYGMQIKKAGDVVYAENVKDSGWLTYHNVVFDKAPNQVEFAMQGKGSGKLVLICDGVEIGNFVVNQIGDKAENVLFSIDNIEKGSHDLQLRFEKDGANTIKLDGFRFTIRTNEIKLDKEVQFLYVNQTSHLSEKVFPEDATQKDVIWSVDKPEIVKVDDQGGITGLKAGKAVVTVTSVTDETVYAKCVVEVREPTWITAENILQAEDATLSGGAGVNTDHRNYSGSGFVDGFSGTNYFATAKFDVTAETEGVHTLAIRYAMGSFDNQTCGLNVNGTRLDDPIIFKQTYSWDIWAYLYRDVYLKKGHNTISLAMDGMTMGDTGNFNLDYIAVKGLSSSAKGEAVFPYLEVRTDPTVAPSMPQTVTAYYENGEKEELPVEWNKISPEQYAYPDETFVVNGTVVGTDTQVSCTVVVRNEGDNSVKASLRRLYKECKKLDESLYTKESWNHLVTAMGKAEQVLKDTNASLQDINQSYLALQAAYNALVLKNIQLEAEYMTDLIGAESEIPPVGDKQGYTGDGILAINMSEGNGGISTFTANQGLYDLTLRYSHSWGNAAGYPDFDVNIVVNGEVAATATIHRTGTKWTQYGTTKVQGIQLQEGENTLAVYVTGSTSDGWYSLDHIALTAQEEEQPVLQEIVLDADNAKVVYEVGDEFSWEGLKVIGKYTNGSEKVLGVEECTVSGFDSSKPGTVAVTIAYQELTAEFEVTVLDKAPLKQLIETCKTLNEKDYRSSKWAEFAAVLDQAVKTCAGSSTQAELDKMHAALSAAQAELLKHEVNRTDLQNTIAEAENMDTAACNPDLVKALEEVLKEAKAVNENLDAAQAQIDAAADALREAIANLNKVDKEPLKKVVSEAETILNNSAAYCPATLQGLTEAAETAKKTLEDPDATQQTVDEQVKILTDLIAKVRAKANKAELNEKVQEAKAVNTDLYTKESVAALTTAIKEAERVLADENADQKDVDAMLQKLNLAISSLEKAEENKDDHSGNTADDSVSTGESANLLPWCLLLAAGLVLVLLKKQCKRGSQAK